MGTAGLPVKVVDGKKKYEIEPGRWVSRQRVYVIQSEAKSGEKIARYRKKHPEYAEKERIKNRERIRKLRASKKDPVKTKLEKVLEHSQSLLERHNLAGWQVALNLKRNTLAETWHNSKVVYISRHFAKICKAEELTEVVIHEIAHALLGPDKGHDKEFVELYNKISPTGVFAEKDTPASIGAFHLTCSGCGQSGYTNRKVDLYCAICFGNGETVKFDVAKNSLELVEW